MLSSSLNATTSNRGSQRALPPRRNDRHGRVRPDPGKATAAIDRLFTPPAVPLRLRAPLMNTSHPYPRRVLIHAAMIADGHSVQHKPGAILLEGDRIVASGRPEQIGRTDDTAEVDLADGVVLPALVNVHCHLDLTHIGPVGQGGSFVEFVDLVRSRRETVPDRIADSVRLGVELSRAGGVGLVGDIAGIASDVPISTMREQGMAGVSFIEVFGLGRREPHAIAALTDFMERIALDEGGVRLGLQPHAPYSCGREVYAFACRSGLPVSTHLAETPDEIEFIARGTGPIRELLERLGVWDDSIDPCGQHPIDHLADLLCEAPLVAAHVNYADDEHVDLLATWPHLTIAYCPRASAYFGHENHRYRDMREAGINIALGTDSVLCLDTADRISVLDEIRFLFRRDRTDPITLLGMATTAGARGLGFSEEYFTLEPGPTAGLIAVEIDLAHASRNPLEAALTNHAAPRWIAGPFGIS